MYIVELNTIAEDMHVIACICNIQVLYSPEHAYMLWLLYIEMDSKLHLNVMYYTIIILLDVQTTVRKYVYSWNLPNCSRPIHRGL